MRRVEDLGEAIGDEYRQTKRFSMKADESNVLDLSNPSMDFKIDRGEMISIS